MEVQKNYSKPTGSEVVMTKDLSYSRLTLMPKDQREARIYYQSKLYEISDTYMLFCVAKLISWVAFLQRINQNIYILSILVMIVLIQVAMRIIFYCFKDRSLRLFGYHLVILYGLEMAISVMLYHIKISQLDDEDEKESQK